MARRKSKLSATTVASTFLFFDSSFRQAEVLLVWHNALSDLQAADRIFCLRSGGKMTPDGSRDSGVRQSKMGERNTTEPASSWDPRGVTLLTEQLLRLRDLPGFQKHHKVPQRAGNGADAFVADIAADEISREVEEVYRDLKTAFAFKRGDTEVANVGDGTATIATPYFHYSIRVTANPANPAQVLWRRMVDTIAKPEPVLSQPFAEVFGNRFNTLEFSPPGQVDLETLIDRLEDMEDERITLDYDTAITYCSLKIEGLSAEITITADALAIAHQGPVPPSRLLQSFFAIQEALFNSSESSEVRKISFDRPA